MKPGEVVGGRFALGRLAGEGGMGAVFEAEDRRDGRRVALKAMRGDAPDRERFLREAEVLGRLRHPGIVAYVAHGVGEGGELFLVMEWLEGEDLFARLWRERLSIAEAVVLAERAAGALAEAHAAGVVHRDLKPSNLFLPGGRIEEVKLLDFGIAGFVRPELAPRALTATGLIIGTPAYMAPEQARGERRVGPAADVFSLGCVLFEALTGKAPFHGQHVMAILAKILLEEPPRLRELVADVPPALDTLVARMLEKTPEARPPDGAAVAAALAGLAGPMRASLAPPRMSLPPPSLGAREQRLVSIVMAAGVLPASEPAPSEAALSEAAATQALDQALDQELARGLEEAATLRAEALERDGAPTERRAPDGAHGDLLEALRALAREHGAELEPLANGSVVMVLSGGASATDFAAQAARAAQALRAALPQAPVSLATGRAIVTARRAVGEAIDRAAELLARPAPVRGLRLDDATAGLLDPRFELGGDGGGLLLLGERPLALAETARTLLGKPTPFVGREAELGLVTLALEACFEDEEARSVVVTAAAGVGKSRLRQEFVRTLVERELGAPVWFGFGEPMRAGSTFGMIAPMLRRAAGIVDGEPLALRRQKLGARLARHAGEVGKHAWSAEDLSRVTEFLGEMIQVPAVDAPEEESVMMRAARRSALLMGDQLRRAWGDLLEAEARARPLVLVLEDLHWGDVPSVEFVDEALRRLEGRPLFVLALGRPELHERFPKLWAERGAQHVELGPLKKRGCEKLVRAVLGDALSHAQEARLIEHAAGNAFYLEELVRAAAMGQGEHLPETVLAMVEARLGRLEPEARRVLRAGSVFGQVFWRGAVLELLGGEGAALDLDAKLEELVKEELLVTPKLEAGRFRAEAAGEAYAFRHALVREAAYGMLTDEDRLLGHQLAGRWLERAGETDAAVLAEHFERGQEREAAAAWYQRAAEQALEGNDFAGVIERAERATRCGVAGERLGELRLLEAKAHSWREELAQSRARALEAMMLLPEGSADWFQAAKPAAMASGSLGDLAALADLTHRIRARHEAGVPDEARTPALAAMAVAAELWLYAGRRDLCGALLELLEGVAAGPDDASLRSELLFAQTTRAYLETDYGAYVSLLEARVAGSEREGDKRRACIQRSTLGDAYQLVGAYDQAERVLREALADAQRMGLERVASHAKRTLGPVLAQMGRLDEARPLAAEGTRLAQAQANGFGEGGGRISLALLALLAGDLEEAEREARRAVEILKPWPSFGAYALAVLADVLLAQRRAAEALPLAQGAMAAVDALGGQLGDGDALVRLAHAEALFASGDEAAAREAIRAAAAVLEARAVRISDPALRASFLENVPEHARTLALARAWTAAP